VISAPARTDALDIGASRLAALSFQQVCKRFGNSTLALDNASSPVTAVSRTCLLGPNVAGKQPSVESRRQRARLELAKTSSLSTKEGRRNV